jgi:hypothetical protein
VDFLGALVVGIVHLFARATLRTVPDSNDRLNPVFNPELEVPLVRVIAAKCITGHHQGILEALSRRLPYRCQSRRLMSRMQLADVQAFLWCRRNKRDGFQRDHFLKAIGPSGSRSADCGQSGKPSLRIIAGGQTGVDRLALSWAIRNGVPHGGWCPKGRRAEDGRIPLRYRLTETRTSYYGERTRLNVRDSDGTVIITKASGLAGGSKLTASVAKALGKPLLVLNACSQSPGEQLARFVIAHRVHRLNVAGSRASRERKLGLFVTRLLDGFWAIYSETRA